MKKLLTILLLCTVAWGATRTWNSSGSTDMNDGNNYDPTGAILTSDDLVFDATSVVNATATAAIDVQSITVASGYSGAWSQGGQTITCSGAFSSDGVGTLTLNSTFTQDADGDFHIGTGGTSTISTANITLQGTGNFDIDKNFVRCNNLTIAASGKTTTVTGSGSNVGAGNILTIGAGTLTINTVLFVNMTTQTDPLVVNASATINGGGILRLNSTASAAPLSINVPAITLGGTVNFNIRKEGTQNLTVTHTGIFTAYDLQYQGSSGSAGNIYTVNTGNYAITTTGPLILGSNNANITMVWNAGSSVIDVNSFNTTTYQTGPTTLNLQTSTWTIGGDCDIGTGTTIDGGTSSVTINGTSATTLTSSGETWYDFTINKTSNSCTLADAISCNNLTLTDGVFDQAGYAISCNNLTVNSTDTKTFDAADTVSGDLTVGVRTSFAQVIMDGAGQTFTFPSGDTVSLASYTSGDMDGVSFTASSTAYFDNPAGMAVSDATVTNIHALETIDATDGGTDGGGTSGWTFPPSGPTISTHPAADTVVEGATASYYIEATGTAPVTWQWQRYNGSSWSNEPGATDSTLSFTATAAMDGDSLRCIVTDADASDTSNGALLDVLLVPSIASISPTHGTYLGGDTITITGTQFGDSAATSAVMFGDSTTTLYTWSDTEVLAIIKAGTGTVSVSLTNNEDQSDTLADAYTYDPKPVVDSISPTGGNRNQTHTVTIYGSGFLSTQGTGYAAIEDPESTLTITSWSATSITGTARTGTAGAQSVFVFNSNADGDTLATAFTFDSIPVILSITPAVGDTAGGDTVTLAGFDFEADQGTGTVTFGGTEATSYESWATGEVVVVTPAGTGAVDVILTNNTGDADTTTFTFQALTQATKRLPFKEYVYRVWKGAVFRD